MCSFLKYAAEIKCVSFLSSALGYLNTQFYYTLGYVHYSRSHASGLYDPFMHSNARKCKRIHRLVFQRALPNILNSI